MSLVDRAKDLLRPVKRKITKKLRARKNAEEISSLLMNEIENIALAKDISKNPDDEEARKELFSLLDSETKPYKNLLRDRFVKTILPRIYMEESRKPIEDKVIFFENGFAPSPSGRHLSEVIEEQGKYKVVNIGLKIRRVTTLEYYLNACRFVRELATAKAVFLSTANSLLSHIEVRPETKVIQLWHGIIVLKKIGYSTADNKKFGLSKAERNEFDQYRNYTYITLPSEEQKWVFEEAMHIDKDSGIIVPVGISRTDLLYDKDFVSNAREKLLNKYPQIKGKKLILYAPTFRGRVEKAKAPDALDLRKFADKLSDEYVMLVKHHGVSRDVPEIPEDLRGSFAFDMGKDKLLDIEELIAISDICITDYSSVGFEFTLMERPVIFFAYDLEDYIDNRGMYYDFEKLAPGPVLRTNEEVIDYIDNIEERFDKSLVLDFKNKFANMCDGHATERTIALLDE